MKKIISLFCAASILASVFSMNISAAKKDEDIEAFNKAAIEGIAALQKEIAQKGSYSYFLAHEAHDDISGDALVLNAANAVTGTDEQGKTYVEWVVNPVLTSRYYIKVNYTVSETSRDPIERKITVNGVSPYTELENFKLEREYYDVSEPEMDYYGNEIRAESEENKNEISNYIYDYSYYHNEPLSINLDKGVPATFRITANEGKADVKSVTLVPAGNVLSYKEWFKQNESKGITEDKDTFVHEAEKYTGKSSTTIYPISDRTSPVTTPYKVGKIRLNTVGGYHWNGVGNYIKWTVNAPKSGLYKITLRVRQNAAPGVTVSRTLYINGEIPFKEAKQIAFQFNSAWKVITLGGEEDYYFYLKEGQNEIKLQNTLGAMDSVLEVVRDCIDTFNSIYRKFLPVLSSSPDLLRDYRLDKLFPEQIKLLGKYADIMTTCGNWLEYYCGKGNAGAALIRSFVRQLKLMHKDPDKIPKEFSYFKSNIGSLSTWLADAMKLPLEVDLFVFGNDKKQIPKAKAGFFRQFAFDFGEYIASYVTDYSMIGTKEAKTDEDSLTVWVSAGREHAQIISNMTVKDFTPKTGIPVAIKNVSANLMTATVAGIGPDLVIRSSPDVFNYAMRNAAYPLSDFPDFDEVAKRFDAASLIPLRYLDKYYGLPESIGFEMLFYRTDIFKELGLKVPQTWAELISISSILANNNMEIAMSSEPDSFLYLLKQHNLEIYKDDGKVCILDDIAAINVFDMFTNFFVSYGFPLTYNFVNRFRTGEIPIGVANFSTYNNLQISAPEINGLWDMALLPGTPQPDGSLNRMATVSVSATMMLSDTDKPEEAWEYMKWWLEAEQQITYADEIESVLGKSSRYNSANIEAFNNSNWTREQRELINAQKKYITAIGPVPGSYYLGRNINNAFRSVVYKGTSPTDALFEYTYKINAEIDKKRREFGLETR
ncbi:MAG: extracellular solute-binding protein [Acutalibacteraceae bacterium]|jgi:ABC-type glycerol-3-phosphate transport system substrate-binding protein